MSICRITPDCDLYIYDSGTAIMCHTAARDDDLTPIDRPYAGLCFTADDYSALLAIVVMLQYAGYRVPARVVAKIRERATAHD